MPKAPPKRAPKSGSPTGLDQPGNANQPPGGGKSAAEIVRKSNLWRDNYNPLRALTIGRLLAIFEAAERGAYAELQLTLRKAEKRYPILKGFVERLLSALEELDWDVKIKKVLPSGATKEMADRQKKFLESRYDLIGNLTDAVGQLALADIRGYTILQKHRYDGGPNDGAVKELYWLEPWCWARDGYYGDFFYNEQSRIGVGLGTVASILGEANRIGGDSLPRENFVMREVESPIYEIALLAMVNWLMARKDWAAFVEIFGLLNAVVIMPPNIPVGKEADFQAAAEQVANGVSGALPHGSSVEFPAAGSRAEAPFEKLCEAQDKDVVLAGTGGQLTMLANDKGGLGDGPAEQHDDAWAKVAKAKARKINEAFHRDFDAIELAAQFPNEPVCVYFKLGDDDEEDATTVATTVQTLEGAGYETDAKEVTERTGFTVKRKAAPAPAGPPNPTAPPAESPEEAPPVIKNRDDAQAAFAAAIARDLQPLLAALDERMPAILAISDASLRVQKFSDLWDQLAPLRKDIAADPAAAQVLMQINAAALAAGLKGEKK
jgi:phage gp29-like protein